MGAFDVIYRGILDNIEKNVDNASEEQKDESIRTAIRLCLYGMSILARNFQQHFAEPTRFASNIMTYIEKDSIADADKDTILTCAEDFMSVRSFDGVAGVLYLQRELSSSTDDGSKNDPLLKKDLAIPIPSSLYEKESGRQKFLPGAATAFVLGDEKIDDCRTLLARHKNSDEYHEMSLSIFKNIDTYFTKDESGKQVRSFVSIRLPSSERADARVLAVVNLHCDRPYIFSEYWVYRSFLFLSFPILDKIRVLLKMLPS